ncbi:uncharacterized protein ARMOST_12229 [Armillaria ostoyae]|uniref:Uncharacterized protein n=1 Tax=Armillaria ostoyae TaxID=47428 RepID=A0A284RJB0_ARMOS|nr:uncharacterized protein ARMOST_12229 [Armillaria ostoyae]
MTHVVREGTLLMRDFLHPMRPLMRNGFGTSHAADDIVDSTRLFSEGGGVQYIDYDTLSGYIRSGQSDAVMQNTNRYVYVDHLIKYDEEHVLPPVPANYIRLRLPLSIICSKIPVKELRAIAKMHIFEDVNISYMNKASLVNIYSAHDCYRCRSAYMILKVCPVLQKKTKHTKTIVNELTRPEEDVRFDDVPFPPAPLDNSLSHSIITDFCSAMSPNRFEESGCCVCGQLTPMDQLSEVKHMKCYMSVLENPQVTRMEHDMTEQPIRSADGPVIDEGLPYICIRCRASVREGKVPAKSLANGLWLGAVPEVLSKLTFAERLLVSKVRHNCCFVKVSLASVGHPGLGSRKMISHIISFDTPVAKVYNILPPPRRDMDDVLAVLFMGPEKLTEDDMKRTPLLVRQRVVLDALEWLLLNHRDYSDVCISHDNMLEYVDNSAPVEVVYRRDDTNKVPEGTSVFDMEKSDGTSAGACPVVVHGLVGEQLTAMKLDAQKMHATRHFKANRGVLAVGHAEMPESIYNNPSLYTSMFPWLFPYGMGGVGTTGMSDAEHKKWLLMYHDKRFQTDINFPFVMFSHEQIKASTTGGYLLTKKDKFHEISDRIFRLDEATLTSISERMKEGIRVVPNTKEEKDCFQLINDLDHVAYKVSGSLMSKKYMRNEVYSLMASEGAPSWYITFAPTDSWHPIAMYWADQEVQFLPLPKQERDRIVAITSNPVAAARFFKFMVDLFIEHVLRAGSDRPGAYGNATSYYGTVEQQGRLTLHLHLVLWIRNSLSPQEIRDRLIAGDSEFRRRIIEYLKAVHTGDYYMGTHKEVKDDQYTDSLLPEYVDPTTTLPSAPPPACSCIDVDCDQCKEVETWWGYFRRLVDHLISTVNMHSCHENTYADGTLKKGSASKGCKDNKWGKCRGRFPRAAFEVTTVDPETGHIDMKKREPWINTFTPLLTYLFRCNTDVTSLRSGTAIKAVLIYVSDYITKPSLKTHVFFDVIKSVFQRNKDMPDPSSRSNKARKMMTQMVNSLGAKMEIGAPMICSYLLGFPDHYTNRKFATFYWRSFVAEARNAWKDDSDKPEEVNVQIKRKSSTIVGISPVEDYIRRPTEISDLSLYEWICRCERMPNSVLPKSSREYVEDKEAMEVVDVGDICDDDDDCSRQGTPSCRGSMDEFIVDDEGSEITQVDNPTSPFLVAPRRFPDTQATLVDESAASDSSSLKAPKTPRGRKTRIARYMFLPDHPLVDTHHVAFRPESDRYVPNFVGGLLPRRDVGDREFYCSTMLALFKPWRSGIELKSVDQNWSDSFDQHQFLPWQNDIMNNFNLRYECLDARDDHRAQMIKEAVAEGHPMFEFDGSDSVFMELSEGTDGDDMNPKDYEVDADEAMGMVHGVSYRRKMQRIAKIQRLMGDKGCKWAVPDESRADFSQINVDSVDIDCTASEWKELVMRLREETLAQRKSMGNGQAQTDRIFSK